MTSSDAQPQLPTGAVQIPEHVVRRAFDEETVLLNLQTGQYHGLNSTAGTMLDALEATADAAAAAQRIAQELDMPLERIEADLAELCDALARRGLIQIDG